MRDRAASGQLVSYVRKAIWTLLVTSCSLFLLSCHLSTIMDVNQLREQLANELRDQLRAELIAEFSTTIDNLRAELRAKQAPPLASTSSSTRRPKASLPDPEKFTGSSIKFDTWDAAIRAKLAIDGSAIGDATAQFYYVYLNLDSKVQAMVLPQLATARDTGVHDYNTILDQLRRVYDNPNKVQEAEDRLLSIKQGEDSLPTYIAKFERILYEAKGQDWPDVTKISTFRKGLNNQLRNRLTQQLNLPRTYVEFLRVVQQLAGYSFAPSASTTHPTNNNGDRMDLSQVELGTISTAISAADLAKYESTGPSTVHPMFRKS